MKLTLKIECSLKPRVLEREENKGWFAPSNKFTSETFSLLFFFFFFTLIREFVRYKLMILKAVIMMVATIIMRKFLRIGVC